MSLTGIPPELQSNICDYLFEEMSDDALTILSHRVPANVAIRGVCRELYEASKFSYKKAEVTAAIKRQEITNEMISGYEKILPRVPVVLTNNLCLLALTLSDTSSCKHECAKHGCYMCADAAHQRCFECGRNLTIALWSKMPKEARSTHDQNVRPVPQLIQFGTGNGCTRPTNIGRFVANLQSYNPPRDQFNRIPWAFKWWQTHYQAQLAIDLRCNIRRYAVKNYWQAPAGRDFNEFCIMAEERPDRRLMKYEKIRNTIGGGVIEWRPEYERRARFEAAQTGQQVKSLIPLPPHAMHHIYPVKQKKRFGIP